MGRVGVIRFSQLSTPCPNGHRVCLSASCWLTENEISHAIRLEAGYQLTALFREGMEEPDPNPQSVLQEPVGQAAQKGYVMAKWPRKSKTQLVQRIKDNGDGTMSVSWVKPPKPPKILRDPVKRGTKHRPEDLDGGR